VAQISPAEYLALARREPVALFDVRSPAERDIVQIEGAVMLDDEGLDLLLSLPREAPVAFLCHHGVRSQRAALDAARDGFVRLYNIAGGIDAWARTVDPRLRRY
jgi:monothiol glutaredoxin